MWGQRFENLSYPRSFNISKVHKSSDNSTPGTFYITPSDQLITKQVEEAYQKWISGHAQATTEEKKLKLTQLERDACQQVAMAEIKRSAGYSYVNQQRLSVIVCKPGFNNFELTLPVLEIKPFLEHFDNIDIKLSNVKYSKDEIFICQKVEIQVPGINKTYRCELNEDAFSQVITFPFNFDHLTH